MTFGDDYNDIDMLRLCGMGVAVENALLIFIPYNGILYVVSNEYHLFVRRNCNEQSNDFRYDSLYRCR